MMLSFSGRRYAVRVAMDGSRLPILAPFALAADEGEVTFVVGRYDIRATPLRRLLAVERFSFPASPSFDDAEEVAAVATSPTSSPLLRKSAISTLEPISVPTSDLATPLSMLSSLAEPARCE